MPLTIEDMGFPGAPTRITYPLVMTNIAIENGDL